MSYAPSYKEGSWKAICESCGRIYKAEELRLRWDGFWVCPSDFEYRQPQDFVRGVPDIQTPPWTRPEPIPDQYELVGNITAIAGYAVAGIAVAGSTIPYIPPVPQSSFNITTGGE